MSDRMGGMTEAGTWAVSRTRRRRAGLWTLLALVSFFWTLPVFATDYFVDATDGRDSNTGLMSNEAWKTVAKVNGFTGFQAGDQVFFMRGEVWHEALKIPASNLTFGAYGSGDLPVIDATVPVTGWVSLGGNIYSMSWPSRPGVLFYKGEPMAEITTLRFDAPVPPSLAPGAVLLQIQSPLYTNLWVTARGRYTVSGITRYRDRIATNVDVLVRQLDANGREQQWSTPLGRPTIVTTTDGLTRPGDWTWDGDTLYLYSDVDPDTIAVEASTIVTGIDTKGHDDLTLTALRVRGAGGVGILLNNSSRVTVSGVEVYGSGLLSHQTSILLLSSSNCRVENSRVESVLGGGLTIYAWGTAARNNIVSGNIFDRIGSGGISLSTDGGGQSAPSLVTGNLIENNTIQEADRLVYDAAGIYTLFSGTGNVIRGNAIRHGGSSRLRSAGIMVDQGSGPLRIENNLVSGNSNGGIAVSSAGHTLTGNQLLYNGATSWATAQMVFFPSGTTAADCTVTSNYFQAGSGQNLFYVQPGTTNGHTIDFNEYHDGTSRPFSWNSWSPSVTDFAGWQQASGRDTHSTYSRTSPPRPPADFRVLGGAYLLLL